MPKKAQKYCLIFCKPKVQGDCGQESVVKLDLIPENRRKVDAETKLTWKVDGKNEKFDCKIVKIADSRQALKNFHCDSRTGVLLDPTRKAYSENVMAVRKEFMVDKRAQKANEKKSDKNREVNMTFLKPVFAQPAALSSPGSKTQPIRKVLHSPKGLKPGEILSSEFSDDIGVVSMATQQDDRSEVPAARDVSLNGSSSNACKWNSGSFPLNADELGLVKGVVETVCPSVPLTGGKFVMEFLRSVREGLAKEALPQELQVIASFVDEMGKAVASQKNQKMERPLSIMVPDHYFIGGADKVEVHPGTGFFFTGRSWSYLTSRVQNTSDWRSMVKAVLIEVYGDSLMWMSAKGRGNSFPVHKTIHESLFRLAQDLAKKTNPNNFEGCTEFMKMFNAYVNKVIWNKKPEEDANPRKERATKRKRKGRPTDIGKSAKRANLSNPSEHGSESEKSECEEENDSGAGRDSGDVRSGDTSDCSDRPSPQACSSQDFNMAYGLNQCTENSPLSESSPNIISSLPSHNINPSSSPNFEVLKAVRVLSQLNTQLQSYLNLPPPSNYSENLPPPNLNYSLPVNHSFNTMSGSYGYSYSDSHNPNITYPYNSSSRQLESPNRLVHDDGQTYAVV